MDPSLSSHQQIQYENLYQNTESDYGFPDRKISDGSSLQGKRILSLGSGTGWDLWYLSENNFVVGLDYALSGLTVAGSHHLHFDGFYPTKPERNR